MKNSAKNLFLVSLNISVVHPVAQNQEVLSTVLTDYQCKIITFERLHSETSDNKLEKYFWWDSFSNI